MPEKTEAAVDQKKPPAIEPVTIEETKPEEEAKAPEPVPFPEPSLQRPGPTPAQHEWMQKHPDYAPMAHATIKFSDRGNLHADGTFVPESVHPCMDGGGVISVGKPISARRR